MSPAPQLRGPMPVRPAQAADLPALVELERLSFPEPWPESALAGELARAGSIVLVVADGRGKTIAYANFHLAPGEGELMRLAVHPGHRRRGLASRLLAAGLERLEARGAEACYLEVRTTNAPALAFYLASGFSRMGRRPRYYADGTDALIFLCPLPRRAG